MTSAKRALVALESHDTKAWQLAIAVADKICNDSPEPVSDVVLLIHTKAQLSQTGLANYIGAPQAKLLEKGGALSMPSGAKLRCETMKTVSYLSRQTVVIVYWAERGILDFADGLDNLTAIIAVPEFANSADVWEQRWSPTVFGRAAKVSAQPLIADPVVERALESLAESINLSTGLLHPRDKETAKEILRILRAHDHAAEPEKIKSWAITKGWKPKDAADLATLAGKILCQTTKPSLSGMHNPAQRYQDWL